MRHLSKITLSVGLLLSGSVVMAQKPAQPLCEQPVGRCVDAGKLYTYGKKYVGHDEPSLLFYSNIPGSGNSSIYLP
jgi:hypothetical protein